MVFPPPDPYSPAAEPAPAAPPPEPPLREPRPVRRRVAFNARTMTGALTLAGMVLLLVAGVLALLIGLDRVGGGTPIASPPGGGTEEGVIVLLVAALAIGCALMAWFGMQQLAGVLGIVAGVILVVIWPETAGVLAVLGGVVLLLARYVPEPA